MNQQRLKQGRYIRAIALTGLEEIVMEAGGDYRQLLEECGISPSVLTQVDRLISYASLMLLLERIAQVLDIPDLGLRWTRRLEPIHPQLGPVMAIAKFTSTIREWLKDAQSYWVLNCNATTFELIEEVSPGVSLFRKTNRFSGPDSRQISEHFNSIFVSLTRHATGRMDEGPIVVRFHHSRPKDTSPHEAFFRCRLEFGAEFDEVEFSSEVLDYPLQGFFTPLRSVVRRYVQHRMDSLEFYDPGVATSTGLTIASLIGTGKTDLASIADAMHLSPKKLQRLLAEEGSSFSQVLEEVRKVMAQELMSESGVPVGAVAELLGYSGNAPFTLAFKRWTGMSPMQWRKSAKH